MKRHRHFERMYRERLTTAHPNEQWLPFVHPHVEPLGTSPPSEDCYDDTHPHMRKRAVRGPTTNNTDQIGYAEHSTDIDLSPYQHASRSRHEYYPEHPSLNFDISFSRDVLLRLAQQIPPQPGPSRVYSSERTDVRKREPRCLGCRYNPSKPRCDGVPICESCTRVTRSDWPFVTLLDTPYLNWRRWAGFCNSLAEGVCRPSTQSECPELQKGNFILTLWFEDKTCMRDLKATLSSIYEPSLAIGTYGDPARPPAISLTQLDNFIIQEMVGVAFITPENYLPTSEEAKLLEAVALFTGYHSLLRNLDTTWFESSAFATDQACRIAAAEFVFALIYQLNLLYVQFATLTDSLVNNHYLKRGPAMAFYALEIVYRIMKSLQGVSWNTAEANTSQALIQLENEFNHQSEVILNRILTYDCVQLKTQRKRGKIYGLPAILDFARSTREKRLPSHLSVTIRRHGLLQTIVEPFPFTGSGSARYSIVDILRDSNQSLTEDTIHGRFRPRKRFPEYMIENDNTKVVPSLSNTQYETHEGLLASNTSTGGPTYDSTLSLLPGLRLPPLSHYNGIDENDDTASTRSHCGKTIASEAFPECRIGDDSLVDMASPSDIPARWHPKIMELFTAGDSHPEEYIQLPFSHDSAA